MREIDLKIVESAISDACNCANKILPEDLKSLIMNSAINESNKLASSVLDVLCDNFKCAEKMGIPVCQDTGMVVVFAEIGQDVHFVNGNFIDSINKGVANAYIEGKMRCSIVKDPLDRINTGNNTPAVIYTNIVPGDKVKFTVCPKGFGSENMSCSKMFTPAADSEDIINFVVDVVKNAGSNPCPPIVVGVGIGGTFDYCSVLSKKALARSVSSVNSQKRYSDMEKEIIDRINALDIGPQGFGGNTTCLAVNIETFPTHIAGLPVAVNIGCHVTRHHNIEI